MFPVHELKSGVICILYTFQMIIFWVIFNIINQSVLRSVILILYIDYCCWKPNQLISSVYRTFVHNSFVSTHICQIARYFWAFTTYTCIAKMWFVIFVWFTRKGYLSDYLPGLYIHISSTYTTKCICTLSHSPVDFIK